MTALLASPRLVEAVIAAVLVEGAALVAYRRRTGRGVPVREVVSFLGAGLALLLAIRAVGAPGTPAGQGLFAIAMAAALGFHVWHLAQRWDV